MRNLRKTQEESQDFYRRLKQNEFNVRQYDNKYQKAAENMINQQYEAMEDC